MHNSHAPPGGGNNSLRIARQINNEASLLSHPRKHLSLHTPANTARAQSPGLQSPGLQSPRMSPSSLSFQPESRRRSPSPALARKSSASSLRGDPPGSPRGGSRRASFVPNMPSPMGPNSPMQSPPAEKPPLRASDVAEEYFRKELARHDGMAGTATAGTIVIVHDQCYGHRYSRPKTPKSTLSLIMERPERILASVLGISAAYVRLGDRHSEGSHPPHPRHNPPERIPFKIRKTSRMVDITSPVVTNVHGTKWMGELESLCTNAERKLASTGKELARDGPGISAQVSKRELHQGDLYLCPESMNAFQGALGGVLDAVDAVFQGTGMGEGPSRAFVCIRPPGHHCSDDWPSGFCWLNNVHVGIEHAIMKYGLTHAAIIDFDLHHGDGSQAITWARNKKVQGMSKNTSNAKKTSIGYFSLHDINSYPCEEGDDDKVQAASLCIDNAHGQSIWNVHLQPWKTPEEFWNIYEDKYLVLLEKTRQYLKHHTKRLRTSPNHPAPKAAIFLSAGFDASEWETAGMQRHSVNVPTEFYARFTRDVVRLAEEDYTGVDGRVISVLEGGYSDRALASGVMSHLSGLCDGQVWNESNFSKGLAFDMSQRLGGLSMQDEDTVMQSREAEPTPVSYDPGWWHSTQLTELENLVNPPPAVVKKSKAVAPSHFSSPTQSFVAKIVDPTKLSRNTRYPSSPSRAPTPPPPEVDWATAAHALSQLLIPADRQTRSHRPEDLAEPKVKKEKAPPALKSVHEDPSGRQLRGRKAVATYADPGSDDEQDSVRPESRASRRKTIADFSLPTVEPPAPTRPVSRRMSVASSVSSIGDRSVTREPSGAARRRSPAPVAAPANGVVVKKARGAPAAAPPVPRIPSNYASKTGVSEGQENDDVDALISGVKRITLKMPSREEYEAREKEKAARKKALEPPKKAPAKTTTRKPAAPRTSASKPPAKPATAKRGRPPKSSKPASPVEPLALTPESPHLQTAANAPLAQPQPVPATSLSSLVQPAPAEPDEAPAVSRRTSTGPAEPPSEHTPIDLLREQLPKPAFMTITQPPREITPPARADTPPPPPPTRIPVFVNYNAGSFSTAIEEAKTLGMLSPVASVQGLSMNSTASEKLLSAPAGKRQDLPVFSAKGVIPFANAVPIITLKKEEEEEDDLWEIPETPAR